MNSHSRPGLPGDAGQAGPTGHTGHADQAHEAGLVVRAGLPGDSGRAGLSGHTDQVGEAGLVVRAGLPGDSGRAGLSGHTDQVGEAGHVVQTGLAGDSGRAVRTGDTDQAQDAGRHVVRAGSPGDSGRAGRTGDTDQAQDAGRHVVQTGLPGSTHQTGRFSTVEELAQILLQRFDDFHRLFLAITDRAEQRFLTQDMHGYRQDAAERLQLHTTAVQETVETCRARLSPDEARSTWTQARQGGGSCGSPGTGTDEARSTWIQARQGGGSCGSPGTGTDEARSTWIQAQRRYVELVSPRGDRELAETFYNSVTRRLFGIVGLDRELEFIWLGPTALPADDPVTCDYRTAEIITSTQAAVRTVLDGCSLGPHFADVARDVRLVADRIEAQLADSWRGLDAIDVLKPVFYRQKGAYLVGRLRWLNRVSPCILPIVHDDTGIHVDAALLTEPAASRLFSYARSYMHVNSTKPAAVVAFLKSMLPVKPVAELYTSLGYSQHGKTNLFRALYRHMEHSNTRFEHSRGAPGTVMAVFALPSFDVVFKVIKDRFPPIKRITAEEVKRRYRLVFGYDRLGRLVDAQEFENLTFARDRFDDDLLEELQRDCSRTVTISDNEVILGHVYTERRVYPLDLYLREMSPDRVRAATLDYGNAIKDLAAANIFPGDLFPKNFGVTRLGAVVFYDYDELALLSEVNFRPLPAPADDVDELQEQPWFPVGADDVFPEEFSTFLRSPPIVGEVFEEHHPEIATVEFWQSMKQRNRSGDFPDFFPYPSKLRFHSNRATETVGTTAIDPLS